MLNHLPQPTLIDSQAPSQTLTSLCPIVLPHLDSLNANYSRLIPLNTRVSSLTHTTTLHPRALLHSLYTYARSITLSSNSSNHARALLITSLSHVTFYARQFLPFTLSFHGRAFLFSTSNDRSKYAH